MSAKVVVAREAEGSSKGIWEALTSDSKGILEAATDEAKGAVREERARGAGGWLGLGTATLPVGLGRYQAITGPDLFTEGCVYDVELTNASNVFPLRRKQLTGENL